MMPYEEVDLRRIVRGEVENVFARFIIYGGLGYFFASGGPRKTVVFVAEWFQYLFPTYDHFMHALIWWFVVPLSLVGAFFAMKDWIAHIRRHRQSKNTHS